MRERTTVVVVGGGPAGLTVANLLKRSEIDCVVLEARSREHVFHRQRAGVVEYRAVLMFERWGLAEVLGPGIRDGRLELRYAGATRLIGDDEFSHTIAGSICPQQILVRNLIDTLEKDGGDLRFGAADVALSAVGTDRPLVSYRDDAGETHEIECDFVAGCDGDHGVSHNSIPDDALATHMYDHGFTWLTVLADAQPPRHPLMAVSSDGFAAQFPRGPGASRFYLECAPGDRVEDWPAERIWDQLKVRLEDNALPTGPITDTELITHRSIIREPMSYGRLYLLGDAAHIVPPLGGKGMNLALHDAEVFTSAVRDFLRNGDAAGLTAYSEVCLERVWSCQEFSRWLLETTHHAGDSRRTDAFHAGLARARLHRLLDSVTAQHAFIEVMAGLS
jgi:p-hydroxybenzoate 3-monooxygenase